MKNWEAFGPSISFNLSRPGAVSCPTWSVARERNHSALWGVSDTSLVLRQNKDRWVFYWVLGLPWFASFFCPSAKSKFVYNVLRLQKNHTKSILCNSRKQNDISTYFNLPMASNELDASSSAQLVPKSFPAKLH